MLTILFDGIAYGMLLFILAVGLSVTMGLMNFINLAHGAFAMAGGYLTVVLIQRFGVPFLICLPLAFLVTGFLGALTTFSSFSAEVVAMLGQQRYALALGTAAVHLLGSLLLTQQADPLEAATCGQIIAPLGCHDFGLKRRGMGTITEFCRHLRLLSCRGHGCVRT